MFSGKVLPPIECKYSVPRFTWTGATVYRKAKGKKMLKLLEVVVQVHALKLPEYFIITKPIQI